MSSLLVRSRVRQKLSFQFKRVQTSIPTGRQRSPNLRPISSNEIHHMHLMIADYGPLTFLTLQRLVPVIEKSPRSRLTPEAPISSGMRHCNRAFPKPFHSINHDTSQKCRLICQRKGSAINTLYISNYKGHGVVNIVRIHIGNNKQYRKTNATLNAFSSSCVSCE